MARGAGGGRGTPKGVGGGQDAERRRLAEADGGGAAWRLWGPYVSERAWASVREDYSASGDAWSAFPHEHARSRAYRWNEDGLAAVCDERQRLCLGLALWNGRDPILKERPFGLGGPEGNHGEDVKDYWWYLDSTPTHSWMSWRYHYPQAEFPYNDLAAENRRRGRAEPEYELIDTGVFDEDRYWQVTVDYAKAAPGDLLMRVQVRNMGPEQATLHVLPTLWFRNTWTWQPGSAKPTLRLDGKTVVAEHPDLGRLHAQFLRRRRALVLRQRDELRPPVRGGEHHAVPEGRHQRPRRVGGGERQSGHDGDQGGVVVPAVGRTGRAPPKSGCAWPAPRPTSSATSTR